jgi:hypothetical protein
VLVNAGCAVRSLPAGLRIDIGTGGALRPMMWMFIAILVTFLITRTVTRLIRSGSGGGAGLGNVRLAGVHIHHQVFGILLIIGTGIVLVSATPQGAALDAAAAVFGVGVSLTLDEFALWLHLEDVYWAQKGRSSVDAVLIALVVGVMLLVGANPLDADRSHGERVVAVTVLVNLCFALVAIGKGRGVLGVVGVFVPIVAVPPALRLARPSSPWARRWYPRHGRRWARANRRFPPGKRNRWDGLVDLFASVPLPTASADL